MGSGFKSSLYACLHLMPDWMRRVTDDYKEEECGVREWGLHLLEKQGRAAVWAVSSELGVRAPGVAALACRLMERYINSQMRHLETHQLQRFQQGLRLRIPALIASCVQIAAKSNSAAISLSASHVCSYLFRQGVHHSVKDVVTWEYHVFQTIGYRVPLWTSVEVAELLAVQARLPPTLLEPLGIVVNLAEYKRDRLDRRVRWVANVSPHKYLRAMEGFLHHMAPQFLHPALQSFGCGAFRPIGGAFHPLYPGKAFARHLGEQYALGQSVGQALRSVRDDSSTPPLYRHYPRDDTSSPGSAASASPRPCKDDEPPATAPCTDSHDFFSPDGERKSACGVCGARLGPGVAQAHFLQELQHLYSLSALPRDAAPPAHSLHHQDEDARWETYQRIRANRQRRLKLRTRKRHHTVESMLGYDLEEERREERPREPRYDAEDEPVDVEGDSLGWPDQPINLDEKETRNDGEKLHLNYAEDLEISSTNDAMQSPERVRIETPKPLSLECAPKTESAERPAEVSTSEWAAGAPAARDSWPAIAAEAYAHAARHKLDGENLPSSTDSRN
ncbi:uncharacterized protein LOC134678243 [Cydia fagiglandana]|uniref:uncharacterized protein LOC134678243 n=1 Tax=Cydia fagiglandana TaxID=1458189 RepID=UPI002FEE2DD9